MATRGLFSVFAFTITVGQAFYSCFWTSLQRMAVENLIEVAIYTEEVHGLSGVVHPGYYSGTVPPS